MCTISVKPHVNLNKTPCKSKSNQIQILLTWYLLGIQNVRILVSGNFENKNVLSVTEDYFVYSTLKKKRFSMWTSFKS